MNGLEIVGILIQMETFDGPASYGLISPDEMYAVVSIDSVPAEWQKVAESFNNTNGVKVLGVLTSAGEI